MRISKGFCNQIQIVSIAFCSEKTELYIHEQKIILQIKKMKIGFYANPVNHSILFFWILGKN